jgi:glycosyltransferase involved in cell wall biosynthesis
VTGTGQAVSACVLTCNERGRLAECLERLAWADEIVVVDDESTDGTVEVARHFTSRVFVRAKQEDFAAQRNFAMEQARGEWMLFVDADERVTEVLRDEIREAVGRPRHSGYLLRRQEIHFGHFFRHGESLHVPLLRLARRGAGRWVGRVHERWRVLGPTAVLRHPLLHYSHADIAHFVEVANYYTTLDARRLLEEGRGGRAWQLIAYPFASFIRNYVWRQGFRDGTPGFIFACLMALHPFLSRAKLLERRLH